MIGLIASNQSVPLQKVTYKSIVNENIGEFIITQEYLNSSKTQLLEAKYIFPLTHTAIITNLKMTLGERTLTANIIKKDIARQEYKKGIETKHRAVLFEKTTLGYLIKVGNIEPNERVTIQYTYLEDIIYESNDTYKVHIPMNIAPHYTPSNQILTKNETVKYSNKNEIKFEIDITWFTPNKITYFASLTHEASLLDIWDNVCRFQLVSSGLKKDFNLLCRTKKSMDCQYYDDEKNVFCSYYIKLDSKETIKQSQFTNIFVLDCSGSMEGSKIDKAKEALILFMRSLTADCKYNIITYGDDYKKMYPESVVYNESNFDNTLKRIQSIDANMGGTELLKPINYLLDLKTKFINVFVLTDGQISNTEEVVTTIRKKRISTTRFFTIGFGEDADRVLCNRLAETGAGKCDMIVDVDNASLRQTLINQYVLSTQDYYYGIDFDFDRDTIVMKSNNYVLPNTVYKVYTKQLLKDFKELKKVKPVKMTYITSVTQEVMEYTFHPRPSRSSDTIRKLFYKEQIKCMESGQTFGSDNIIDISIKNRIICNSTAFVIVDNAHTVNNTLTSNSVDIDHYEKAQDLDGRPMIFQKSSRRVKSMGLPSFSGFTNSLFRSSARGSKEDWFEDVIDPISAKGIPLSINRPMGMNTVGSSLKMSNFDISDQLPVKFSTSPWIQSTVEPDTNIKRLDKSKQEEREYEKEEESDDNEGSEDDGEMMEGLFCEKETKTNIVARLNINDISNYQNFNGSFKYIKEVLNILNVTEDQLKTLALSDKCNLNKVFHMCIQKYLENKSEYVMVLRKLNDYLKTL
jgi:hypothetical protein